MFVMFYRTVHPSPYHMAVEVKFSGSGREYPDGWEWVAFTDTDAISGDIPILLFNRFGLDYLQDPTRIAEALLLYRACCGALGYTPRIPEYRRDTLLATDSEWQSLESVMNR